MNLNSKKNKNKKNINKNLNKNNKNQKNFFVCVVLGNVNNHVVSSELSGNNGSWTNCDDHDSVGGGGRGPAPPDKEWRPKGGMPNPCCEGCNCDMCSHWHKKGALSGAGKRIAEKKAKNEGKGGPREVVLVLCGISCKRNSQKQKDECAVHYHREEDFRKSDDGRITEATCCKRCDSWKGAPRGGLGYVTSTEFEDVYDSLIADEEVDDVLEGPATISDAMKRNVHELPSSVSWNGHPWMVTKGLKTLGYGTDPNESQEQLKIRYHKAYYNELVIGGLFDAISQPIMTDVIGMNNQIRSLISPQNSEFFCEYIISQFRMIVDDRSNGDSSSRKHMHHGAHILYDLHQRLVKMGRAVDTARDLVVTSFRRERQVKFLTSATEKWRIWADTFISRCVVSDMRKEKVPDKPVEKSESKSDGDPADVKPSDVSDSENGDKKTTCIAENPVSPTTCKPCGKEKSKQSGGGGKLPDIYPPASGDIEMTRNPMLPKQDYPDKDDDSENESDYDGATPGGSDGSPYHTLPTEEFDDSLIPCHPGVVDAIVNEADAFTQNVIECVDLTLQAVAGECSVPQGYDQTQYRDNPRIASYLPENHYYPGLHKVCDVMIAVNSDLIDRSGFLNWISSTVQSLIGGPVKVTMDNLPDTDANMERYGWFSFFTPMVPSKVIVTRHCEKSWNSKRMFTVFPVIHKLLVRHFIGTTQLNSGIRYILALFFQYLDEIEAIPKHSMAIEDVNIVTNTIMYAINFLTYNTDKASMSTSRNRPLN